MRQYDPHRMFGKGKLLQDGAQAEGLVIESVGPANTGRGGMGNDYHVKVRVTFDDGSTTEIKRKLKRFDVGLKVEGDIVPLRYDASDRSKIEIDEPTMRAVREANSAQLKQAAITHGEQRLMSGTSAPGVGASTASAIERMLELTKRHESGALTDAEFEAERARIQAGFSPPPA